MLFEAFIIVLVLLILVLGYRMLMKPDHERIINKLGNEIWLVDKTGVGEGASFYVKFGKFEQDPKSTTPAGKVHFTKYGQDKAFEYDADLEWSASGEALRVGQMKLVLKAGAQGRPPAIMYTNNVESVDSWTAPLREVNPPSKKL